MKTLFRIIPILAVALLLGEPVHAQNALDREAGFVDFRPLENAFPEAPRVEVNVKGSLLRLVTEASRHEDPGLAEVLGRLRAVQVRTYDLPVEHQEGIARQAENLSRRLTGAGWETVVRVRENDEQVDFFLREDGDLISGLMVMVIDRSSREATFVNIVGEIDPAEIAMIGRRFDIDPLRDGVSGFTRERR